MENKQQPELAEQFKQWNNQEKKKLYIIDTGDGLESKARDVAESRLTESQKDLKGIKGWAKRVWKYNMWREVTRQNEIAKVRQQIRGSENLFADETEDRSAHDKSMAAIVERFSSEYDQALHTEGENSETKEILNDKKIHGDIKALILDYANGKIDEAAFQQEKVRIFSSIKGKSKGVIQKGDLYASNLLEIAKESKESVEHGKQIEDLDLDFEIIVGRAKAGVRTEANFNTVDKIVEKIKNNRVGAFVNETTLGVGVATAYSLSAALSKRIASSKVAAWGSFGATAALGAGIAAGKEGARLEEERRQHGREMAQGGKYDKENSPRREELEKFRIETKESNLLAQELEDLIYDSKYDHEGKLIDRKIKKLDKEQFNQAMLKLGEIRGRNKYSEQNRVDMISYSDAKNVESERTRLDILSAQASVDLRNLVLSDPRASKFLDERVNFEQALENSTELFITTETKLRGDESIEKKNEMFKKMKRGKVAKAAVKGLLTGIAVGATAQEVVSMFKEDQIGLTKTVADWIHHSGNRARSGDHYTALAAFVHWVKGDLHPANPAIHESVIAGHHFKLPDNLSLKPNTHDHTWSLVDSDGKVISDHVINSHGDISPYALHSLEKHGVTATNYAHHVVQEHHENVGGAAGVGPKDYLEAKNYEGTKRITRDLWYENDTPKPVFDKNELKLWWGGHDGSGIDAHGNYVYNVKHMAPDGSYEGKFSADAQQLMKEGKLKLMISLSRDTQLHAFEVPIDADGNAIIDPNSEVGKLAFATVNGHAKFLGKFAEVSQIMGEDKRGVEHIRLLATEIGHGLDKVPGAVDRVVREIKDTPYTILNKPGDYRIDPPPFVPVFGRFPLEPAEKSHSKPHRTPEQIFFPAFYYYGSGNPERQQRIARKEGFSENLKQNPEAKLDPYFEITNYLKHQNSEYLQEINRNAAEMGEMDPSCRLAICIPVAGHEESNNIYKTLENYTYQQKDGQPLDPKLFEIALYVNHPQYNKAGEELSADATLKEIERFKQDFPEINLRVFYEKVPNQIATIGRARKVLSDTVLQRYLQRGEGHPDLIMVSNDADNKGMSTEYVSNFIDQFDENPNAEAMVGQLDWDVESYMRKPLLHIGTRLMEYISVLYRNKHNSMNSSGANFAYRSSIYAGVGGYDSEIRGGEDTDLGFKITRAREGTSRKGIVYAGIAKSRLFTSSRRAERVLKLGLAPIDQWTPLNGNEGFQALDEGVRGVDWDKESQLIDFDNPREVQKFVRATEDIINKTVQGGVYNPYIQRAIGWLGVKFRIEGDKIRITDATKLLNGLREYQEEGKKILEIKTKGLPNNRPAARSRAEARAEYMAGEDNDQEPETLEAKASVAEAISEPEAEPALAPIQTETVQAAKEEFIQPAATTETSPESNSPSEDVELSTASGESLERSNEPVVFESVAAAPETAKADSQLNLQSRIGDLENATAFRDFIKRSGVMDWKGLSKALDTQEKKSEFARFIQDIANRLLQRDPKGFKLFDKWASAKGIGFNREGEQIRLNGLSLGRMEKNIRVRVNTPKASEGPSTRELKSQYEKYFESEFKTIKNWDVNTTKNFGRYINEYMQDFPEEVAKQDYKNIIFQKELMQALQDAVNEALQKNFKDQDALRPKVDALKALGAAGFEASSVGPNQIQVRNMARFIKKVEALNK